MAVEIGALRALLSLDTAAFENGAKRAQASMSRVQRHLSGVSRKMRDIGRDMTLRVSLPMAGMAGIAVRTSLKTVDAQAKMAESLDTTVISVQNLTRASELAGITQGDLEGSLRRMTRRVSLAAQEMGPAKDALERLNLSAETLNDLPVDERVNKINQAIRDLIPEAEQAGVASQIFGDKTGLAIMRLNPAIIAQAADEVRRFGVGVSEVDADKIEAANDALSSIGEAVKGLSNRLTVALAPALKSMSESIGNVAERFSNLSPKTQELIGKIGGLTIVIGPAVAALGLVAAGMAAVATPIGLVVAGIAALTAGVVAFWPEIVTAKDKLIEFGRDGIDWVKGKFEGLLEFFRTLPERMVQVGENIIEGLKQGLMQKWEDLKATIVDLGSGLPEWIKDPLGMNSPSKVFMQIGRDVMAGLGIGLAEGEGLAAGPLAGAADRMRGQMDGLRDSFALTGETFGDMVADIATNARKAGDVLSDLGNRLLSSGISGIANSIFGGTGLGSLFAGFFDQGGVIPAGQFAIAGERGPEIVTGPARVTSRADTARLMGGNSRVRGKATLELVAPEGFSVRQRGEIQGIAVRVTSEGLSAYDRSTLPDSVQRINNDPLRRN
jgi:hypothetical protein